ncbi:hypothetical protein AgCh_013943 [Apium graveolens]
MYNLLLFPLTYVHVYSVFNQDSAKYTCNYAAVFTVMKEVCVYGHDGSLNLHNITAYNVLAVADITTHDTIKSQS